MLNGVHFYHATIKRIVSVFGTIFNNIVVGRHSGNKISNIMRVPISYGPREKFLARINQNLNQQRVAIKLPRMSFEITSIEYDTSTKLNRLNKTITTGDSPGNRNSMFQSVPYTLGMQLNIMAKNQEDALQILEQILPTFSPEYTVAIKDIEGVGSKTDVPFILNSVSFTDDYEADMITRRTIIYTLDFTIRVRFAPDVSKASIIKRVETDIADFTNVTTATADVLSQIRVSADSPSAPITTFVSLINPDDIQTINLAFTSFTLSGLTPLNEVTSISVASGGGADADRVENETLTSTIENLASTTDGSGTDATFGVVINGVTGATNSVSINNGGSGYADTDTITISAAPYDNTNLVLDITGVDGSTGAITGVSITSGDAANTDVAATFTPTFTRVVSDASTGGGDGLTLNVLLDKTGAVVGTPTIIDGGVGYTQGGTETFSASQLGEDSDDSPLLDLVVNIDSVNSSALSGTYVRNGTLNNRPKYNLTGDTNTVISYSGAMWELKQGTTLIASSSTNTFNVPTDWGSQIPEKTETLSISSTDTADFTIGEEVQGNVSLGLAIVVSSSNHVVTANNLEAQFTDGEVLTGLTSGVTRTVFNTIIV